VSTIKKIFKEVERGLGSKDPVAGIGIDITDLVGKDLLNSEKGDYANVGAGINTETKKPLIGASVKKGQVEAGIAGSSSTDLGLGAKYTSKDELTSASVNAYKDQGGKNIMFNIGTKFKSGGSVEVGKGKDYIKDLI
jgi:hypothetical protein